MKATPKNIVNKIYLREMGVNKFNQINQMDVQWVLENIHILENFDHICKRQRVVEILKKRKDKLSYYSYIFEAAFCTNN